MSISLNNHESRIKALENKAATAGTWTKSDISGGICMTENSSGFTILAYSVSSRGGKQLYSFPKAFKTKVSSVSLTQANGGTGSQKNVTFQSKSTSQYYIYCDNGEVGTVNVIAIGYLISDRILNYAYACKSLLFTPLKTIGGVK